MKFFIGHLNLIFFVFLFYRFYGFYFLFLVSLRLSFLLPTDFFTLLLSHLFILLFHFSLSCPLLPKGDAGLDPQQEALICLKISDILSFAVLVQGVKIPQGRALEMITDLTKIALKFSGPNITSAIACLAHIAGQITRSPVSLLELAEKCFSSIVAIAKVTSTSTSTSTSIAASPVTHAQAARIQRCLVVLGSICEQSKKCSDLFQFSISDDNNKNENRNMSNNNNDDDSSNNDNNDDNDDGQTTYSSGSKSLGYGQKSRAITDEETAVADLADIGKVTVRNLNGCCYSACHYALSLPIPHVQARAVQSLCGVFVGTYHTLIFFHILFYFEVLFFWLRLSSCFKTCYLLILTFPTLIFTTLVIAYVRVSSFNASDTG